MAGRVHGAQDCVHAMRRTLAQLCFERARPAAHRVARRTVIRSETRRPGWPHRSRQIARACLSHDYPESSAVALAPANPPPSPRSIRVKTMTAMLASAVVVHFSVLTSCADSFGRFQSFRKVDLTGRHYVVVKLDRAAEVRTDLRVPVIFEIAECRPGSSIVRDVADFRAGVFPTTANPDVSVRHGDILRGAESLRLCSQRFWCPQPA